MIQCTVIMAEHESGSPSASASSSMQHLEQDQRSRRLFTRSATTPP